MENTTVVAIGNAPVERRKENKLITFQDRRVFECQRAANHAERLGHPVSATMFRNEAYRIEQEGKQ